MTCVRIFLAASSTFFLLTACESQTIDKPAAVEEAATAAAYVFVNGGIYSVDSERSWAQAVAISMAKWCLVSTNAVAITRPENSQA